MPAKPQKNYDMVFATSNHIIALLDRVNVAHEQLQNAVEIFTITYNLVATHSKTIVHVALSKECSVRLQYIVFFFVCKKKK